MLLAVEYPDSSFYDCFLRVFEDAFLNAFCEAFFVLVVLSFEKELFIEFTCYLLREAVDMPPFLAALVLVTPTLKHGL